ncbi:MAG: HAD family hydrolase [Candidatus Woesearchaeota archaeon]
MKAVLFDFWGTIIENGIFPSPVKQAKFILRIDMPFGEYIERFERSFMTKKADNLTEAFRNVCEDFDVRPPEHVIDKLVGMWNKNTLLAKPFDDTFETIKALRKKGIKVGLISNTDPFSITQLISKFELDELFDTVILSYNIGLLKADAEMFDKAIAKLGVSKEDTIMVGDSIESDMRGAENAGVKGYLIDRKDKREYENKITSLREILEMV